MSENNPGSIQLGSTELPEVLRTLAGVLPQFRGADLESQLQTFDVFLGILAPNVRPQIAALLNEASKQVKDPDSRGRLESAVESILQGGRAAEPYNHEAAMKLYREEFQRTCPPMESVEQEMEEEEVANDNEEGEKDHEISSITTVDQFREQMKRRAIWMEVGGFRPPEDPHSSWFGRVTMGLENETWPSFEDRGPMLPLAQIDLTTLPFQPPLLEDLEFLTLFIYDEAMGKTPNGTTWCLRAYPKKDKLVPLLTPPNLKSKIRPFPLRPKIIEADYPSYDDAVSQASVSDELDELEAEYDDLFENYNGFKLGGWPTLMQGEIIWPSYFQSARPRFVFQIDSNEKAHWGWRGGVGYFGRGTTAGHEQDWFLVAESA